MNPLEILPAAEQVGPDIEVADIEQEGRVVEVAVLDEDGAGPGVEGVVGVDGVDVLQPGEAGVACIGGR